MATSSNMPHIQHSVPNALAILLAAAAAKDRHEISKSNKYFKSGAGSSNSTRANDSDNPPELRELVTWHADDEISGKLDQSLLKELADCDDTSGWKADEMFEYNERMHKIHTTYNEKTLSDKYTTPLPVLNPRSKSSKYRAKIADKIAEEIQRQGDGRVTPESSDDDELFLAEQKRRVQRKQFRQSNERQAKKNFLESTKLSTKKDAKSSSLNSNTTETPATISLSSSPTLNETVRPITSSHRNILRTCLSMS